MSHILERRYVAKPEVRSNAIPNSPGTVTGRCIVVNSLSQDLGGFKERIHPDAVARVLRSAPDIRALWSHDTSDVLGRTKNGTLRLSQNTSGDMCFALDLPNTSAGRDAYELVKRSDVSGCSFGFECTEDDWSDEMDEETNSVIPIRVVRSMRMFEMSLCAFPAYEATEVSASDDSPLWNSVRELWPTGLIPVEVRNHLRADHAAKRVRPSSARRALGL
jgi:HK97 family phage prohead protease